MKNAQKKDILPRAVSTGVLTNSVFFVFCVSLNFVFSLKNIKIGFQPKKEKHKKTKNLALKTGPS